MLRGACFSEGVSDLFIIH